MADRATPPETPPPIITRSRNGDGRSWASILVLLAVALVIAGAVVLGGRWIYNQVRDNEPSREVATDNDSNNTPQPPATTQNESNGETESRNQDRSSPVTGDENDELADTGPGSAATIFLGTAAAVAALHYAVNLRRA